MTDEEKAEKFVKENCCEFCINKDDCEMGFINCNTKEGVLYGLAEGRKETLKAIDVHREENDKFIEKLTRADELEKENAELKKQWHDCFLSCSSPYCAGYFPAVKMQGELGNISKREVE